MFIYKKCVQKSCSLINIHLYNFKCYNVNAEILINPD